MTGLHGGSRYEFKVFVSNIAGRKREPARKEFNVYSGVGEGPDPGKNSADLILSSLINLSHSTCLCCESSLPLCVTSMAT